MQLTFPFGLILIPYAIFIIVTALIAIFAIYHLVHYGATSRLSLIATFTYLVGTIFIFVFTFQLLAGTDWKYPVTVAPTIGTFVPDQPKP